MKYTIYKNRKTGYYHLNIRTGGERLRPSLHTKDRRTAQIEADLKLSELGEGVGTRTGKSVFYLLDLYRSHSLIRGKAPGTLQNEKSIIGVFKDLVRDRPLLQFDELAAGEFFKALNAREGHTLTGRGNNYYLRTLRTIWKSALTWRLVDTNVFSGVEKFPVSDAPPRVLRDDEIIRVFQALKNRFPAMIDVMLFLLFTGMRRNEVLGLTWADVDLIERSGTITKAKQRKFRVVPLFRVPREILIRRLPLARPFADAPTGSTLSHDFFDAMTDAGIPHAKLHDLRKTFGTMLARANVNPYTIMAWLGHANADVTLTHYIGMDTETADRLDDIGAELASRIYALKPEPKRRNSKNYCQPTVNSALAGAG